MKMIAAALAALMSVAFAQAGAAETTLFSDSTPLDLTISAPMSTLIARAAHNTDPYPGAATVAGAPQPLPVQVSARGITRRNPDICSFPPIKLDFETGAVAGTILEGQHKLKLVDPCQHGQSYEQLVVLEYLAYRLLNVITPLSYRVRAVNVTFIDTDHRRGNDTHFGYLIEDEHEVAHRNHLHALNVGTGVINASELDGAGASRFALFEYMISNLDWDMVAGPQGASCCHNAKLLGASSDARADLTPIPSDYDYSGLVDAPYSVPPAGIHVNGVRQRYFRGYCRFNDQLAGVIGDFDAHKSDLFAVIDNEPALDAGNKRSAHAYLQDFFNTLEDPAAVQRNLTGHCRGGGA
jgi:hypothetical protein